MRTPGEIEYDAAIKESLFDLLGVEKSVYELEKLDRPQTAPSDCNVVTE